MLATQLNQILTWARKDWDKSGMLTKHLWSFPQVHRLIHNRWQSHDLIYKRLPLKAPLFKSKDELRLCVILLYKGCTLQLWKDFVKLLSVNAVCLQIIAFWFIYVLHSHPPCWTQNCICLVELLGNVSVKCRIKVYLDLQNLIESNDFTVQF